MNIKSHLKELDSKSKRIFQMAYPEYGDNAIPGPFIPEQRKIEALKCIKTIPENLEEIMEEMINVKEEYDRKKEEIKANNPNGDFIYDDESIASSAIKRVEERNNKKADEYIDLLSKNEFFIDPLEELFVRTEISKTARAYKNVSNPIEEEYIEGTKYDKLKKAIKLAKIETYVEALNGRYEFLSPEKKSKADKDRKYISNNLESIEANFKYSVERGEYIFASKEWGYKGLRAGAVDREKEREASKEER